MRVSGPLRLLAAMSLLALGAGGAVAVQGIADGEPVPVRTEEDLIGGLAQALEDNFLDPPIGARYAAHLRSRQAAGAYRGKTPRKIADAVTDELQAIHPDGHLRLRAPAPQKQLGAPSARTSELESADTGIERSGWLTDGVAYIGFTLFPSSKASLAAVRQFLDAHSSARALIIDVRTHGGGFTDEFDLLASHLFDRPVELIQMDTRQAAFNATADTPTLRRIAAPAGFVRQAHWAIPAATPTALRRAKVFVLTSGYTGSAAEHLALALKRTGRATLIGEVTAGMGHFGRIVELPGGFSAFIPIGRPFGPSTGEGWEGTGVVPHFTVPARDALSEALRQLGIRAADARRIASRWAPAGEMGRVVPLRGKPLPAAVPIHERG